MKKRSFSLLCIFLLCFALLCAAPQRAEAASSSFSGSDSLRAGNTVTVTFSVSGSNVSYIEATLHYDSSTLEYHGSNKIIGGKWDMQENNGKFQLEDTSQSSPINSSKSVFSVTFRVKSNVPAGTTVSASISGYVSNMSGDSNVSASWSAEILPPLSGDANLKDLWCDNAELNFTGGTEYSLTVPYEVSSLDLDWSRSHSGSSVSVSGNSLSVGSNTVTVTVEAENGTTKRYYIYVTRQQDPNYVPSTDATLSSLSLSAGTLSPAFSSDVMDYVVYLPYETTSLTVSAAANDSKAKGVSTTRKVLVLPDETAPDAGEPQADTNALASGEPKPLPEPEYRTLSNDEPLPEGETIYTVTCTAEDGTTIKEYTIHVIRMPAYEGVLPEIIAPVTEPVEPEPEPEPPAPTTYDISLPLVLTLPYIGEVTLQQAALGVLIALGVLLLILLLIAWAIGRAGGRRKALRKLAQPGAQPDAPDASLLDRLAATQPENEEADSADATLSSSEEAPAEENGPAEENSTEDIQSEEASVETADSAEDTSGADKSPDGEATEPEVSETPDEPAVAAAAILPEADTPAPDAQDAPAPQSEDAAEDAPAETPEETLEETPEEAGEETPEEAGEEPAAEVDDLAGMSLDDLLEDIRNM